MSKKLDCIKKLIEIGMYDEFKEYIVENKLAGEHEFKTLNRDIEKARFIYETLGSAAKDNKLILLDFEWSFLPIELIKITCVTETGKKEFTYGY